MKRDPRLRALSLDHHHALRLAHRLISRCRDGDRAAELWPVARAAYSDELLPHFRLEEELLLPGLEAAGATGLVERTRQEHAELGRLLEAVDEEARQATLLRFAELLAEHVRFEERVLFPAAESKLSGEALDRVGRRNRS